jgi:uncharacterized membrane protein
MTMRTLLKPIVTAVLVAVLGGPALAAARPERPVAAQVEQQAPAARKPAAQTAEAARYAARETKAQNLEQFKGGALNVYIGGTALAIAAFIVLLLVIL